MIEYWYKLIWDVPLIVGIYSCFFMVRILYRKELKYGKCLMKKDHFFRKLWEKRKNLVDGAFSKNLVIMFSHGTVIMMIQIIWIGGVGSLFWFLLSGLMTTYVKYIQIATLSNNKLYGNIGIDKAIISSIGGKRHFKSSKIMVYMWKIGIMIHFILLPQLYCGIYMSGDKVHSNPKLILLVLAGGILIYATFSEEAKRKTIKLCLLVIALYTGLNIWVTIKNIHLATLATEAILRDAFQFKGFVGDAMGKGMIPCVSIGTAMGIYMGNFVFDNCIIALQKEEESIEILGSITRLITWGYVGYICFFVGFANVMSYISNININKIPNYGLISFHSLEVMITASVVVMSSIVGGYEDLKNLHGMLPEKMKASFSRQNWTRIFLIAAIIVNLGFSIVGFEPVQWIKLIMILMFLPTIVSIFLVFSGMEDYKRSLKHLDNQELL